MEHYTQFLPIQLALLHLHNACIMGTEEGLLVGAWLEMDEVGLEVDEDELECRGLCIWGRRC